MKIVPFAMVVGDVDDVVPVAFAELDVVDDVNAAGTVPAYYYDLVVVAYVSSVGDFALAAGDSHPIPVRDYQAKLFVDEHPANRVGLADELRLQVESNGEVEANDSMVPVLNVQWSLQRLCLLLR